MPLFDFECPKCDKVLEKLWKEGNPPPHCPDCGCRLKKKFSASGQSFRLYGEGFHRRNHKDTGEFS